MSGHSQFANIKHRKGLQDSKKAKIFIKIGKEIMVAVKNGGADINSNSNLRAAIEKAKANNMPKDNYIKIIKKASTKEDMSKFLEIKYEAYGPCGIAYIIECLTDNINRTAANIRSYFNRYKCSLGQANSVLFLFERKGQLGFMNDTFNEDEIFEWVVENDCENLDVNQNNFLITCDSKKFKNMQRFLLEKNISNFFISEIKWIPKETIKINKNDFIKNETLIQILQNDDDIQNVFTNLFYD